MTIVEARTFLLDQLPFIPAHLQRRFKEAVERTKRNTGRRRKATSRAFPLTEEKKTELRHLQIAHPNWRIFDYAEHTGCAFHDISNYLFGTRR